MKLTKYEHACFTLEKDGQVLVIDPGEFTTDFATPEHVVAVVITHEHSDHLDGTHLTDIQAKNPDVLVLGPADVIDQVELTHKQIVAPGEVVTVGPFILEFFGGQHALIHESMARVQNLGVMINDTVYYPGDSFTLPERPVDVLAIPAAAPWMKIGEAMDFLAAVKPRLAFPTHDAIASDLGKGLADRLLGGIGKANGVEYTRPTDAIDI